MRPVRVFAVLSTFAAMTGLQLAAGPAAHAAFLGDRGMVFVSGKTSPSGETDILALTYRDGSATLVQDYTPNNHQVNLSPTVSPEGGPHIAFVEQDGSGGHGDIYVMDRYPPGGGLPRPVQLTRDSDNEVQPAWSPSGGKIAYVRYIGDQPQIWTMSLSGLNQLAFACCNVRRIHGRGSIVIGTEPAWSPNSEWIAYVTPDQQIAVASVTGKPPLDSTVASFQVTTAGGTSPNWSPLGDRIAYITPDGQLAMLNFDPSGLPQTPTVVDTPPQGQRDANPAWSPDSFTVGDQSSGLIVFDRGSTLWSIDPKARSPKPTQLRPRGFLAGSNPDWRPVCMNAKPKDDKGAVIRGTAGPDLLCGGKGNDTIYGGGGDDHVYAGLGNDTVHVGPGNAFVIGGLGDDTVTADGPGYDHLEGDLGNDTITDDYGSAVIEAGPGDDMIHAADGVLGNDRVDGGTETNTCYADNVPGGGPPEYDFVWNCTNVVLANQALTPGA